RLPGTARRTCASMLPSRPRSRSGWLTPPRRSGCLVSSPASRSRAVCATWCAGMRRNACLDRAASGRGVSDRAPDDLGIGLVQHAAELDAMLLDDIDPAVALQSM